MAEEEACVNYRFWQPNWKFKASQRYASDGNPVDLANPRDTGGLRKRSTGGLCRRYAPQASALTTVWMETKAADWCGDYELVRDA